MARHVMAITNLLHSSDIPVETQIGENVHFGHGGIGIVIHHKAVIGDGTLILQNVTIGGKQTGGYPRIGSRVLIGAGAVILGNVAIGDGAVIGANAVVVKDVSPHTVVGGVPAVVLKRLDENDYSYVE